MPQAKYQVLARRYRPQTFRDVLGQEAAVTTLKNALRFDKIAHAYLFCGSRGVGKTTLARLFAKALNCQNRSADFEPCGACPSCAEIASGQSLDVIEIDGASNRGIDDIRQINETVGYAPSAGRYKIYIVDEVHMLTKEAFNALLKTLEEPPEKAKFFFATTEPHKVLPTILSRCQRFDLNRVQISQIISKLETIAKDLGRTAEPEALRLIATFADGSLRDAESLFDQILCFAEGAVTSEAIRAALGLVSNERFFALDEAFSRAHVTYAFELVESLFTAGKDLIHFFEQLIEHVRLLSLARTLGEKALPPDLAGRYLQSASLYAPAQCLYLLEYLLRAESQLQKSSCQRVSLEAILLHYIQSKNRVPIEVIVRRLSELEQSLLSEKEASKAAPLPKIETPQPKVEAPLPKIAPPTPPAAVSEPSLKAVPFNPYTPPQEPPKPVVAAAPQEPPKPAVSAPPKEPPKPVVSAPPQELPKPAVSAPPQEPPKPVVAAAPQELPKPITPPSAGAPQHSQSHYDTLMRFASIELEGSLKLNF
jgi:DNA polymerase-3 subunit gamma/tau